MSTAAADEHKEEKGRFHIIEEKAKEVFDSEDDLDETDSISTSNGAEPVLAASIDSNRNVDHSSSLPLSDVHKPADSSNIHKFGTDLTNNNQLDQHLNVKVDNVTPNKSPHASPNQPSLPQTMSRFKLVHVDARFQRGRWKCWDYKEKDDVQRVPNEMIDFEAQQNKDKKEDHPVVRSWCVAGSPREVPLAIIHCEQFLNGYRPSPHNGSKDKEEEKPKDSPPKFIIGSTTSIKNTPYMPDSPQHVNTIDENIPPKPVHEPSIVVASAPSNQKRFIVSTIAEPTVPGPCPSRPMQSPVALSGPTESVTDLSSVPVTVPVCVNVSATQDAPQPSIVHPNATMIPPQQLALQGSVQPERLTLQGPPDSTVTVNSPSAKSPRVASIAIQSSTANAHVNMQPDAMLLIDSRHSTAIDGQMNTTASNLAGAIGRDRSWLVAHLMPGRATPILHSPQHAHVDSTHASAESPFVAIETKIEQAMDLVKTHLMYAVREEIDMLRNKSDQLEQTVARLEQENAFLREHVPREVLEGGNGLEVSQPALQLQQAPQHSSPVHSNNNSPSHQQLHVSGHHSVAVRSILGAQHQSSNSSLSTPMAPPTSPSSLHPDIHLTSHNVNVPPLPNVLNDMPSSAPE